MADRITLGEVARAAGVSTATASLALSGKGRLSEDTRRQVIDIADSLGYRRRRSDPSPEADPRRTVGILISVDYEWTFVWVLIQPIIEEIISTLENEGYTAILVPIRANDSTEQILNRIERSGVEAVLPVHYGNHILFIRLEDRGIPVVVVMNNNYQTKYYSVCSDDFQGAYEGCSYLLQLGHRDIAFVDCERRELPALNHDRLFGFRKALDEISAPFREDWRKTVNPDDFADVGSAVAELFAGPRTPTAIFALDDDLAVRLVRALSERGLRIPDDVSILAPGDVLDYNQPHLPRITTMKINTILMGRISAELLLNRLQRRREDIHVLKVNQQLVDRGSCRPPRARPGETVARSSPAASMK